MSYQTNNPSWKDGHAGYQPPANQTPQQQYDHERGRLQREAEQKAAYEKVWGNKKS